MGWGPFSSDNQTTSNNTQVDNRVTSAPGSALIGHNKIDNRNGSISLTSADADVAKAGIELAGSIASKSFNAASSLTQASNAIAAQVAASQESFVGAASGQKTFLWGAAILAVIAIFLFRKKI